MIKRKNLLISIFFLFFITFHITPRDLSVNEIGNIVNNIENRMKDLEQLNTDSVLKSYIDNMKKIVTDFENNKVNIETVYKAIKANIDSFEKRIQELRFLNLDDDLVLSIKYLKTRLKDSNQITMDDNRNIQKYEKQHDSQNDNTNKKIKEMIETEDVNDVVEYLLVKINEMEKELKSLKDQKSENGTISDFENMPEIKNKLTEIEQKIKNMESSSDPGKNAELLEQIKQENENLKNRIDSFIAEAKKENEKKNTTVNDRQWGKEFGFQLNLGMQGILTSVSLGIFFPKIKNLVTMGLSANFYISTPGSFVAEQYRTAIISGSYFIFFSSLMFANFIRVYAGLDFIFGSSFSFTSGQIFGNNFSFGGFGIGGMEFYLLQQIAFYIEAGAGIVYTFGDASNGALRWNNTNGTGFRINCGIRIFITYSKANYL